MSAAEVLGITPRYPVLEGPFVAETVVSRSRFLVTLARAESEDEAAAVVARVASAYPDATHHCHAFLIGPPGETSRMGMSDAGEPSGTAGRPMLQALVHGGVGDVVAVCSRWFGGTKLGTGGLVRAYGGAVKEALAAAPRTMRVDWIHARLAFDYSRLEALRRVYARHEVEVLSEAFTERVSHELRLPAERRAGFADAVRDETSGQVLVEWAAPGA